jgi:hypothetical protein
MVTVTAGLTAAHVMFFFIPAGHLYLLLPARRRGAIRYSVLAIQRRWYYAVAGGYTATPGLILLLPSTKATVEIRIAGVILLVWGLLCIGVAVLAFRTKPLLADPRRTR